MKRPLCVLLVIWVFGILLFVHPDASRVQEPDRKNSLLTGEIAELTGFDEKASLVIKNIVDATGEATYHTIKVYRGKEFTKEEDQNSFANLMIGQIISVKGTLQGFQSPGNPGQFDEKQYYYSQGIDARMYADSISVVRTDYDRMAMFLYRVRGFFYRSFLSVLPKKEAGILSAMVLGEKCGLEEETKELFRENGIAHILAISGLHISMIGMGLFALLRRFIMPMRWAVIVTGMVLFLYGVLTGFPLATRRAVIMTVLLLLARFLGERYDRMNALALAAIVELVTHPISLFQSGFLLSYGTVLGIIWYVGEMERFRIGRKNSIRQRMFQVLVGSAGVFVVTLPILVQCYHEIAVFSIPVNIVLLPLMSTLLGTAMAGGTLTIAAAFIGRFVLGTAFFILMVYQRICEFLSLIPWHILIVGSRSVGSVIVYYLGLAAAVIVLRKRRSLFPALALTLGSLVFFLIPLSSEAGDLFPVFHRDGISITNLDVGQGDCTCIRLGGGYTILVDGGSSDVNEVAKYRIVPYLKAMGIASIDMMIVTHSDADHVNGFSEILEKEGHFGLEIGTVLLPDIAHPDENYRRLENGIRTAGEEISYIRAGDRLLIADVRLTCLHPSPEYDWEDDNDYSTVLELEYGGFRAILTGDLGEHGEKTLPEELNGVGWQLEDVDYLKVGHHGSKYSSSEAFLSVIRPEIAVASAGQGNRYHHPSEEAVARLKAAGATFFCTMECGAVTTWTDGHDIRVTPYRKNRACAV